MGIKGDAKVHYHENRRMLGIDQDGINVYRNRGGGGVGNIGPRADPG